jgi:hypothetical protein
MRDTPHLTADDVVTLLRPSRRAQKACRRDVIAAVRHIKEPKPQTLSERQLRAVAEMLAAVRRTIGDWPPEWRSGSDSYLQETAQLRLSFANLADAQRQKGGRNRESNYRQKLAAAQEGFWLLLRSEHAPTSTKGGLYSDVTGKLFEIASGKSGDVTRACGVVIGEMKRLGYTQDKLAQYSAFMARTRLSP